MIAGIFHGGSGLGNQLHRYVMTRVLALDNKTEFNDDHKWGMLNPENFKGASFMKLDMGTPVTMDYFNATESWRHQEAKKINEDGNDVRDYDENISIWVLKRTIIDGEFQGEKYYEHHLDKIKDWLSVEPLEMPDDLCVIGFRGGEYVGVRDLFLPHSYWATAVQHMKDLHPGIRFEVHTDDVVTAKEFFPDFECIHDIGLNWRSVRYANHLIIANSSFYILPSLLGDAQEIIAPHFWAGRNKGHWQLEQNQYKRFTYI